MNYKFITVTEETMYTASIVIVTVIETISYFESAHVFIIITLLICITGQMHTCAWSMKYPVKPVSQMARISEELTLVEKPETLSACRHKAKAVTASIAWRGEP